MVGYFYVCTKIEKSFIMETTHTSTLTLPLPHLAEQYQLRRDITFLNHGSFGACPHAVFEVYQTWQRQLELNPVGFYGSAIAQVDGTSTRLSGRLCRRHGG
jgi:hypothetical protein